MKLNSAFLALLSPLLISQAAQAKLTVYTDRPTQRLGPVAQAFQKETGLEVEIVEDSYANLQKRLKTEGSASPADVLFVKDMVFLDSAKYEELFTPITSTDVLDRVQENMRDHDNNWVAVTYRARTIMYNSAMIDPSEIKGYEDLADPKWAGRLCLRTSKSSYNDALVSSLINKFENAKALEIVSGWVKNLATAPFPNDTSMLEAMANGECQVAIANTYYLGQLKAQNPGLPVEVFFGAAEGVHTNGSGAGVLKTADDKKLAEKFISLLLSDKIQQQLADVQFEYPAAKGVQPGSLIKAWGTFKADPTPWSVIGERVDEARSVIGAAEYK